jgi:cell division transport system permease protein
VHLIGAPDRYIARQFQAQALKLGILGGVVGLAFAAATMLGIGRVIAYSLGEANPGLSFDFRLLPWQWVVLGLLPVIVALLAMFTARRTVMRSLARML